MTSLPGLYPTVPYLSIKAAYSTHRQADWISFTLSSHLFYNTFIINNKNSDVSI